MKPRRIIENGLAALGCVDIKAEYVSPANTLEYCPTWVVHITYRGHRCTVEECHDTSQLAAEELVQVVAEDIESGFIYDRECYEDTAT
jgi:hypothetical protein